MFIHNFDILYLGSRYICHNSLNVFIGLKICEIIIWYIYDRQKRST